ncbi:hypothetical protein ANSO36C_39250 [Nostoc cf. commune SO-36]|uniref:Uncharacterized protein n=1 Tax=Nostoc cf. commune SO-36 TaxID=449208 RepID=A0ABN6Q9H8_NOSCO|nr:hypothetical protein ANSO36C_39250 [Nostoc cf. commune SO-36]
MQYKTHILFLKTFSTTQIGFLAATQLIMPTPTTLREQKSKRIAISKAKIMLGKGNVKTW